MIIRSCNLLTTWTISLKCLKTQSLKNNTLYYVLTFFRISVSWIVNSLNIRDAGSWYTGWAIAHPDFAAIEHRTETKVDYLPTHNLGASSASKTVIKSTTNRKLVLWRCVEYFLNEHQNLYQITDSTYNWL